MDADGKLETPLGRIGQWQLSLQEPSSSDVSKLLGDGLTAQAQAALPELPDGFQPIALALRDDSGTAVGGIDALINWNWLHIRLFWLPEAVRGQGLGKQLIQRLESIGLERGCTHAHLDTFAWQARPFYEQLGYEMFGQLDDYPPGQQRYFMRKRLA